MSGHTYLILTICSNSSAAVLMKAASTYTDHRIPLSVSSICLYILALLFWSRSLEHFGVGFATSITTSAMIVITNLAGTYIFGEQLTQQKLFYLVLIIIGVIGMQRSGIS